MTESCEETYVMTDDQLLDKAPMSASIHTHDVVMTTSESMETEECKYLK